MKKHIIRLGACSCLFMGSACSTDVMENDQVAESLHTVVFSSSACEVQYDVNSQWDTGFGANVRVTNKGAAIGDWTLTWQFADGQQISSLWNGRLEQTGGFVSVSDLGWNGTLGTGMSVQVGFNGAFQGNNSTPINFKLNGVSCGENVGVPAEPPVVPPVEPTEEPTPGSTGGSCSESAFQPGANYGPGDRVAAAGQIFECKPYPYSGWCPLSAYEPGAGTYWQDAWVEVGTCSSGGSGGSTGGGSTSGGSTSGGSTSGGSTSGGSTSGGSTSGGGCDAPSWAAGTSYLPGQIVTYEGSLYIVEHENPGYSPVISTWFWEPYAGTCAGSGGSGGSDSGGSTTGGSSAGSNSPFAALISEADFNALFANRNHFYTYEGLLDATELYPAFAGTGDLTTRKREAAAFLANVTHETGDLVYVEEINRGEYCDNAPWFCPCAPGKRYYGRGPIQLSWNYNYCAASQNIFGDQEVLRLNPERVAQEPWLAWATALWFWMTQNGAGTMTAHEAMVNQRGFGETIRTINGGLECNGAAPNKVQLRIGYYQEITNRIGVSTGSNLGC